MYPAIVARIYKLTASPQSEWQTVELEKKESAEVLSSFVLPLLGLAAIASFVSQLWEPDFSMTQSLRLAVSVFVGLLAGVLGSHWAIRKLYGRFSTDTTSDQWFALVAYPLGIYFLAETVAPLAPSFGWARVVLALSAYQLWHGAQISFGNRPMSKTAATASVVAIASTVPQTVVWLLGLITIQ